jgi:hypothetical protein
MPLVLSVGLTKKLGLPAYSSVGASCQVQVEVDSHLLERDPAGFHQQVEGAFFACREAVEEELSRYVESPSRDAVALPCEGEDTEGSAAEEAAASPGTSSSSSGHNGEAKTNGHQATERQMEFLRKLAGQTPGVGIRRLESFANELAGKPLAGLSSRDASRLIDALKAVKAGRLTLEELTREAERGA